MHKIVHEKFVYSPKKGGVLDICRAVEFLERRDLASSAVWGRKEIGLEKAVLLSLCCTVTCGLSTTGGGFCDIEALFLQGFLLCMCLS